MIDGLNICHEYSKHLIGIKFSAEGLNVVYEHLKKLGYEDEKIVIIMKQIPQRYNSERIIAQKLEDKNVLHYAPSRRSGMKKTIIEGLISRKHFKKLKSNSKIDYKRWRKANSV